MAANSTVDDSGRAAVRPPRPALLLCCVLVAVLASYLPVLGAPFVWDDHHLVEATPLVQELHPVTDYFTQSFWQRDDLGQARTYYRPLTILSLAVDHHWHGDSPGGFHLTNLLVHLLSTALLFRLLRVRGAGGSAAALGSGLWALFPRLTEAVAWIAGRTDVLAGFFVLCALLLQARSSSLRRVLCALFLLLGLFCKEVALAGVAAVLVLELSASGSPRVRCERTLPTLAVLAIYGALRAHAAGVATKAGHGSQHLLAPLAAVGRYFAMLLTPWFPNVQIGRLATPGVPYAVLGACVLLALGLWLARRAGRLAPELTGPLTLAAVGFGLVLHFVPFTVNVVAADRFMYVPLLGLTLLFTPALAALEGRWVGVVSLLLALSFGLSTFARANSWADEVTLWSTTYRDNPENRLLPCTQLGSLYVRAGLFAQGLSLFRGCQVQPIGVRIMVVNAASVLARSGHYAEAAELLGDLDADSSRGPIFGLNLALFKTYLNDFAGARAALARSLAADSSYAGSLALAKQLPELERRRHMLDAMPADAALLERARLQGKLGLDRESFQSWREASASGSLSRAELEEGLSFALARGDALSIELLHRAYLERARDQASTRLETAYQTHALLLTRLLTVWPSLNLKLLQLSG